jgi:transcription elongation GreA/GreB family factor
MALDKFKLIALVIGELKKQKRELEVHAETTHRHAITEDSPMQSRYDTRRFETSELYGNLKEVIMSYDRTLALLRAFTLPGEGSAIQVGSLVEVINDRGATSNVFILPSVRNVAVKCDGTVYVAISPETPLGGALVGKRAGETVTVNSRTVTIRAIN